MKPFRKCLAAPARKIQKPTLAKRRWLAAILAAIRMNAVRGVSVEGAPPKTVTQTEFTMCRACRTQVPELIYIFGANSEFDIHYKDLLWAS